MNTWRWLDTGVRDAAENLAISRALTYARRAGESPSTLRFLRFLPSAIVGLHGDPARELDVAYCRAQRIAVRKRPTGGGAIYMDEGVLGWELHLARAEAGAADMPAIARRLCEAVARSLESFGVAAVFRAPGDVVVAGRKISGSGGAFEDEVITYQGTLLLDFDIERMLRTLGAMNEAGYQSARARMIDLRRLLGVAPDPAAVARAMTTSFESLFGVRFMLGVLSSAELNFGGAGHDESEIDEGAGSGMGTTVVTTLGGMS
ncbi:MAG: lipoate--protein ligase family protein [Betaproteobacteria bacterium]|nr:lipoate--protein ligase family protein [Betaproteobacteria bacterium]